MAATFNAEPLPPVASSQVTSRPAAASVGGAAPIGGVAADGALGAHEAALDPHPQYETASEVTAKVVAHTAAADPHGDRAYADGKFLPRLVSATKRLLGLGGTAPGNAEELTLSTVLDWVGAVARGDILFRGASGWSRLAAGTAGQVLQTGGTSGDPSWVTPSGGSAGGIGCRAYSTISQSLLSGVPLFVPLNAERFDTDNCHSTSTNTSRLTCNTRGLYVMTGNVQITANAAGNRDLSIRKNGTTYIAGVRFQAAPSGATQAQIQCVDELLVGDYVEMSVTQNSGSTLTLDAVGNYTPEFAIALTGTT